MNQQTKPTTTLTLKPEEVKAPKKIWVHTVSGRMVHLFTNTEFTTNPKQHVIDDFLQAQLDAGKLIEFKD
jgi:hypothetical protein